MLATLNSTRSRIRQILSLAAPLQQASDAEILRRSMKLRARAVAGEPLDQLATEAFALVREAASRTLGIKHFEVQLMGGLHLIGNSVIEMETGQGKSLTATLPLYVFALCNKGAHLATSNDYLARRDSTMMKPLYTLLGMTCGHIESSMSDAEKKHAYSCDITYGTGTEFGFDHLRDKVKQAAAMNHSYGQETQSKPVQRKLFFVLVDEADAVLIDDANTPMVLAAAAQEDFKLDHLLDCAISFTKIANSGTHYINDHSRKRIRLTKQGHTAARKHLDDYAVRDTTVLRFYALVEKAIYAEEFLLRDKQYIVRDGEVVLVNQETGRLEEGRQLQDELHQLLQFREGLKVTPPNSHCARLTVQSFFLSYPHLAGMSGTAKSAKKEFQKAYGLRVCRIPTHVPSQRTSLPTCCFTTFDEKARAICDETQAMVARGRCVLIGTRSIAKSQLISELLWSRGIANQVLNAKNHSTEAQIIAQGGSAGAVTVATGMAGRGTDIKLSPSVRTAGGLHVILSEMHDTSRSDLQLIGRCGRQGDPGSYRYFVSLEDELLTTLEGAQDLLRYSSHISLRNLPLKLSRSQQTLERRSMSLRLKALKQDKQRTKTLEDMGLNPVLDALC